MEAESLEAWRRAWTSLLLLSLVFMVLFASSPLASAGDVQRDYVKYVIQVERSTVIEGFVVDSSGEGIENASITGWAHSVYISIDVKTDENGYFRIVLPSEENHEYFLSINENHSGYNGSHPHRGFNKRTVEDTIKSGEHHSLRIPLDYNPFDVELEETSGSLTRGWTPYSYSYEEENRDLTGYTYEQFAGYDASVPNYRAERYVEGYEPVYRTETYQESYLSHYEPVYRTESYIHHYATGVYYTTERVTHTGVYYTYEWRAGYSYGHFYMYQVRVPHYYTYYTYESVPHYYQYPVYAYQEVLDHYEPVYAYRTVTRQVLDHYDPVYAYRTVQDGYKTTRVPSYTTKWRITVEEWDYWGAAYNGTRTFMVDTEAEAAEWWVGKTYSWGWAGSGEVVLKETFYNLSNGQIVTSQPSSVWETKAALTQPARSDSIRNLQVNYKITTTRYSVTDYSLAEWGSRQTTVTATPKNGYTGDVRLAVEANSVQATLDSTRLSFSSSARTTLAMRPHWGTSGSQHPVTIHAHDANDRLVETKLYKLDLSATSKPSRISSSYTWTSNSVVEIPSTPDFNISVHPNYVELKKGHALWEPAWYAAPDSLTVTVTPINGFEGSVSLTADSVRTDIVSVRLEFN
ncbi:MAG: hypothetical protein OEY73_03360, partial [Hadesarchaea archaeon]|nr:hypothetical protein [Hadesarchaea archaeon]